MPGRLGETLVGLVPQSRGLLRFGRRGRQQLNADAALGKPQVVLNERLFGEILDAGQRGQLRQRAGVILGWSVEQRQGQAIAGGVGFLMVAVLGKEFAEPLGRKGIVLLVVGFLGAVQHHLGHLVGRRLGTDGSGQKQEPGKAANG